MTRFGTGLSRGLAIVMRIGLVIVALGLAIGVLIAVIALVDPTVFDNARVQLNGQPVYLRQPDAMLPIAAIIVSACAFAAAILWQLLGMLRTAAAGMPFTPDNIRRLRVLAALFGFAFAVQMASVALPGDVRGMFNLNDARFDVSTGMAALLALVLAEVFGEGVRLREDAEGTI